MRITALDLVRFCAAFAVVLYHYTAPSSANFPTLSIFTQYGYLGVPLFFMISGFVVAMSAENRSPLEFAASRFVRLYPAYWASIALTCLVLWYHGELSQSTATIFANLTMLNDYIGYQNIDGIYWTLQAELKFYGCVFALLLIGQFSNYRLWVGAWLLLTTLYFFLHQPFFMGWFINPSYSPCFIAGVGFYLLHQQGPKPYIVTILAWSYALLIPTSLSQIGGFIGEHGSTEKMAVFGIMSAFFLLFLQIARKKLSFRSTSIYFALGGLTYPLYLMHNTAGKLIIASWSQHINATLAVVLVTLLALATAYLMHIYIEKKLASPMKTFLFGLIRKPALQS